MDFLTYVHGKPKHVRARYALFMAGAVTSIIGVVWLSTIDARFADVKTDISATKDAGDAEEDFIVDTTSQLGNIIDWNKDTALEIQDAVDAYAKLEETEPSPAAEPQPSSVSPQKFVPTGPKVILIEGKKLNKEIILIGTTTSKATE